jgi:hypothetical protein
VGGKLSPDEGSLPPSLVGPSAEDGDLRGITGPLGPQVEHGGRLEVQRHAAEVGGQAGIGGCRRPWPRDRLVPRL